MCGIVGYVGHRECTPILLDGLRRLEYRGYDSAGIAVISNGEIHVRRVEGKLERLRQSIRESPIQGTLGIGHTRWATHGRPSEQNAHPHRVGGVVLVHNGIIENFLELRQKLAHLGRRFESETDTEVLAHVIDMEVKQGRDLLRATVEALKQVKGSYAVAVISLREPDRIVVARQASPLLIGLGTEGESMIASDIPALLDFTKDFIPLDDGEAGVVRADGFQAFRIADLSPVEKQVMHVNLTPAMAEKAGFKHFMLKEIHEQPRAIIDTLRGRIAVEEGSVHLESGGPTPDLLARVGRVHLAACGTSWHAALVGRWFVSSLARIPTEVHLAGEFEADVALPSPGELFVAISQSGETLDTLRSHRQARKLGLTTLAICNTVASSLAREADYVLYTHAGPEISVASTKAFTSQLTALYLLALALGSARGTLDQAAVRSHLQALLRIPGLMEDVLRLSDSLRATARIYMNARHFLYLGRDVLYPVALEGALKLKEISYIHAEGYSAAEMKHGPIALIDEDFPTVLLVPRLAAYRRSLGNLEEIKARNGRIIAVGTEGDEDVARRVDEFVPVPKCERFVLPFVCTVPLQLFAYHMADLKGTDVDQPRNLAKSVTVE